MKISIARGELAEALSIAGKGFSSRSTLPILSGILLTASGDQVVFQSTDLEISVRHSLAAKVEKEGQVVLPGRLVTDIVRSMQEAAVTIETASADRATITSQHASFTVKTLSPDDFPKFPEVTAQQRVEIETETLAAMVRQVGRAVSRDETRPILTGVLVVVEDGTIRLVATDSYRLAVREQPLENPPAERIDVVIPGKAMEEVPKMAASSEKVSLGVAENQVVFEFGETVYVSRRIEGSFPNYKQLIPKDSETTITVGQEELLDAVRRVSLLAQHNAPLRLKVTESTLTLSATTQDVGDAVEDMMVETTGPEIEIAFNHTFLADGVASVPAERVVIQTTSPLKPGIVKPAEGEDFTYLLMPVRLG